MQYRNNDRIKIELLSKSYINSKRLLHEAEEGIITRDYNRIDSYRRIVRHIEYCTNCLDEKSRFIIQNEVIEGKSGKWYAEFYSAASYYRLRQKAYEEFFRCLEK